MYAIFRAGGRQFRAEPDATLRLPTMDAEPGDKVTFEDVLLAESDGDVRVGSPSLAGATVAAEVVRHGKDAKIIVYKMKRRKGYRRKQGHRQGFTEVRILDIGFPKGKAARRKPKPKAEPAAKLEKPEAKPEPAETPAAAEEINITDAARELAEANGIDLATLEGTGQGGRILKGDVEKAIKAQKTDD